MTKTGKKSKITTIRFDDDYTLLVIDRAAQLLNQSRTAFLLNTARERAESLLKEQARTAIDIEKLLLTPKASLDIANTLLKPPKANKKLQKAMKEYLDQHGCSSVGNAP